MNGCRWQKRLTALLMAILISLSFFPAGQAVTIKAVTTKTTRVYARASKKSSSIKIPKGITVRITGANKGCARVKYKGRTGYMETGALKPVTKTRVQRAVAYALMQCGKPYGYSSPKSFNCSSLVRYAFGKAGYSMKGTARAQAGDKRYRAVKRSARKQGDLLFFDTNGDHKVDHVAIAISKNYFVDASSGRKKVRVKKMDSWYYNHLVGVRRVA